MVGATPGEGAELEVDDRQRRVGRSPLLFVAPLVLLILLTLVPLWEIVRSNLTGPASRERPWRLRLMDMNPLGSLPAVALAAVFGRARYGRTAAAGAGLEVQLNGRRPRSCGPRCAAHGTTSPCGSMPSSTSR
ncbi:hypothetical protein STVIR_6930 [Streptomyces viridochromogenes Tue57]|uniref:Uncharacterized protein n=2 Tax=Streptomyces viridochromogenes TaxID=1938 RepID=L8P6S8_STRVR|nr:hypothetical protein STVIR_6930 [Streptomyces viridochromogenes Tue57]